MVVATALSYYYNNLYTDYSQFLKDKNYGFEKSTVGGTYAWRSLKYSPEEVSRVNKFFIDCSGFAYIVYKNSLGYDFSDYYQNARYSYFSNGKKYGYYNMSNSNVNGFPDVFYLNKQNQSLFSDMVNRTGMEPDSTFYANISKKVADSDKNNISDVTGSYLNNNSNNKTQAVYYFEATGNTVLEVQNQIEGKSSLVLDELKEVLQPGDIITYSFRNKNLDGTVTGSKNHVMIYVGDAIASEEYGFIHSTGYDYTYNDDGTMKSSGNDTYSVRYDLLDNRLPNYILTENANSIGYKVSVERPINQFCVNDSCVIPEGTDIFSKSVDSSVIDNSVARDEFSRLKFEQYTLIDKSYNGDITDDNSEDKRVYNTIGKYNSVNEGDVISYILRIQNKANFSYCDRSGYYTKIKCLELGYNWKYSELSDRYRYKNIKITDVVPSNVEYIEGSCTNDCSYDDANRTITWNVSEILPNSGQTTNVYSASNPTYIYSYKVRVLSGKTVINRGMKISSISGNSLQLGSLKIDVNPTFNGINIDYIKEEINKFGRQFDDGKIVHNGSFITNNYNKNLDNLSSSITLAEGEFIKMIYYNCLGIDIGYLRAGGASSGDMLTALFNKKVVNAKGESKVIYYKKTDAEAIKLSGNQKMINQMLVPGLYGGRILRGNDNGDRESLLRLRNDSFSVGTGMNDLEFGDIVFYLSNDMKTLTTFMYYGQDSSGYPIFVKFTKNGLVYYDENSKTGETGFLKFANLYSRDLFWVLRPSRLGTTVKYEFNGGVSKDSLYVAYNTYKNLVIPKKNNLKISIVYNRQVDNIYPRVLESANSFSGWYSDKKLTNRVYNSTKLVTNNNHEIYAKWNTSKVTLPDISIDGYSISGYYSDAKFSKLEVSPGSDYIPKDDVKLYAKWTKEDYVIKYYLNGGINNINNSDIYRFGEIKKLYDPVREGYVFKGWYSDENFVNRVTEVNIGSNSSLTFYAKWEEKNEENSVVETVFTPKNAKAEVLNYISIKLSWGKVVGANGYRIYKYDDKTKIYKYLCDTTGVSKTTTYRNVVGKTSYYKIRAYKVVNGKRIYSNYSSVLYAKPYLKAPVGVKAVKYRRGVAKISFNKVLGASGYGIYKYNSKSKRYVLIKRTTFTSFVTSYDLKKGSSAYYKVQAYKIVNGKRVYGKASVSKFVRV